MRPLSANFLLFFSFFFQFHAITLFRKCHFPKILFEQYSICSGLFFSFWVVRNWHPVPDTVPKCLMIVYNTIYMCKLDCLWNIMLNISCSTIRWDSKAYTGLQVRKFEYRSIYYYKILHKCLCTGKRSKSKISKKQKCKWRLFQYCTKMVPILAYSKDLFNLLIIQSPVWKDPINRRQIDITTYQLLFFLSDTSLCLFGDEMRAIQLLFQTEIISLILKCAYTVIQQSFVGSLGHEF